MKLTERTINDKTIVCFDGRLDSNTARETEQRFSEMLDSGVNKLIVNFEKLEYLSSAGLRILFEVAENLEEADGSLRICSLNETVKEIFEISGFNSLFNVFETEEQALEGF
ncbi:STAS domain-containing protein [Candidatus Riflebacteria bacterium]